MWFGVSLGGNLPGTPAVFSRVLRTFESDGRLLVLGVSRTFRTRPFEDSSPSYWNQCLVGRTFLGGRTFFGILEAAERRFRRRGKGRLWPRWLDADLLFWSPGDGNLPEGVVAPHPRLSGRPVLQILLGEACRMGKIPFSFSGIPYPPGHPEGPPLPSGYQVVRRFPFPDRTGGSV
ncbi:MAG: 2-amino-4-hydroxy-6-hydroxymethyldihydropteridine diphosphokinase [Nitrospirae bacterium]|jgi:2-amino-4-hydroxy-6-hydroxymethyldihydropteridine diphosphokinase|nr:2-amino-4-hydroxy-6-hydroxymethyldihydropteridine diphosphokinase [Nitrospirota bacterium]